MKFLLTIVITCGLVNGLVAQSVGIGTATPNSKAQLDISSTSKGLLIPSMTTSQRLAISSPPNGLMLYDTDKNEFYHYNGAAWTAIVNGTYWSRPVASRDRITSSDSVGIGISAPTDRLDVNGNIRSRNNVEVAGSVSSASLLVTGNTLTGGDATVNGAISGNNDINLNGGGGTLQFKTSGTNKTYVQQSGDNLRMGTNSGNSTGQLVIRMNGTDRISVDAAGTLDIPRKITTSSSGTKNMLPICYGYYSYNQNVVRGSSNFSVVRRAVGEYEIYCNAINANSIIMAQPNARDVWIGRDYITNGVAGVCFRIIVLWEQTEELIDHPFSFIIMEG